MFIRDRAGLGVNNRNLKTFEEDLRTTERLMNIMEDAEGSLVVSESGIKNGSDLGYINSLGADAVLIGETFMRQQDISKAVADLRNSMT